MTTAPGPSESPPQFEPANRIPIADLSPSLTNNSYHILANVALVWPYSSSTGTLALLLADPDIRARKSKGQVKVIFRDGSARGVAQTKVGIGDEVRLTLAGCEWDETGETTSTPGKKIDWDLRFRNRIVLRVSRDGKEIASVDYTSVDTEQPTTNGVLEVLRGTRDVRPQLNGVVHHEPSTIRVPLLTPSKSARRTSGGSFFNVPQDPSAEDDGYVHGRGRKRTKFARHSGAWNLVDTEEQETTQHPLPEAQENGASKPLDQISRPEVVDLSSDSLGQEQDTLQQVEPDSTAIEPSEIDRQGSATTGPAMNERHAEQEMGTDTEPHTADELTAHQQTIAKEDSPANQGHEAAPDDRAEEELRLEISGRLDDDSRGEVDRTLKTHLRQDPVVHSEPDLIFPSQAETVDLAQNEEVDGPGLSNLVELPEQTLEVPSAIMGPPRTPLRLGVLRTQSAGNVSEYSESGSDATTTPRLHPLASPGLPLVSPLVQRSGVDVGYFPLYQDSVSQLDASAGRRDADIIGVRRDIFETEAKAVIGNVGLNIRMEDEEVTPETAHGSSPSDTSVVFVQETTTETQISSHADAQALSENDSPDLSRTQELVPAQEPDVPTPSLDGQHYESTITEQWLSSTEVAINRELYEREESPSLEIAVQTAEVVEIEDDDLYGPPPETASNLASPMIQDMPPQLPISPLDVVEQFLQIASAEEFASDAAPDLIENSHEEPQHQPPATNGPDTSWQEKITVGAVECNSPGTYPAPPFPFQQGWHRTKASRANSRRSSAVYTPIGSLDGNVDDRETFPASLENGSEPTQAELPSAAELRLAFQSADIDNPMQVVDATGEDVLHVEVEETEDVRVVEERPGFEDMQPPEPDSVPGDVDMLEGEAVADKVVLVDTTGVEAIATTEERQTISVQDDHTQVALSPHSPQLTDVAAVQLPTPNDTQQEQDLRDRDDDLEAVQEQPDISAGMPSPLLTQEGAAVAEKVAQIEAEPEVATPVAATTNLQVQPETTAARRSSQRLSTRKSIMSKNISSPYFTPRKAPRAASSSPTRKENINPSTPRLSSPISSPSRGRLKSPSPLQPIEEQDNGTILVDQRESFNTSNEILKRQESGTTTTLAYHPRLESLHEHFGQLVDIIGVSAEHSSKPERSKLGPKDYFTTLTLADFSVESAVTVQIFRPSKTALPVARRGDVILLRNFKVQTLNRTFMLMSSEASSWAVFERDVNASTSWSDVIVAGPPIEYGQGEIATVNSLLSWWTTEGEKHFVPLELENAVDEVHMVNGASTSPSPKKKPTPRSRRRANIADNLDNENEQAIEDEDVVPNTQSVLETNNLESPKTKPLPNNRRRGNMTDHSGNEGEMSDVIEEDEPSETNQPENKISNRRGSTISIASTAYKHPGNEFTPRRSTRHRRSQSVVHELRDGTKYVDDDRRRSGSVVHELRLGATYVDD
ncbi:hypothetical protein PV11_01756 [Exophiala sideris]|uniref:Telomeric single stranded DNA binding POT1/Cdc13 domain-containing protein n=1 Tax=Exophiala sideris TaxID=1016849 RepID=A0A0D1XDT3_9EURO|nr:hypothetical protein PV11_01756 [Exophiala sideris]